MSEVRESSERSTIDLLSDSARPGSHADACVPAEDRCGSEAAGARAEEGSTVVPGIERVPGWEQYRWLRAGFSTRQGGGSSVYGAGEQNLGWTREDDQAIVAANRRRFVKAVSGERGMPLTTVHQIHSGLIRDLETEAEPFMALDGKGRMRGDGILTKTPGRLLGVITADCVPVLVADTRTHAVAAFHAGWRGTLARIVERGIGGLRVRYGARAEDLVAAIGPSIGGCCFAVGEEVRTGFESQFEYASVLLSEVYDADPERAQSPMPSATGRTPGQTRLGPQTHVDLVEANRLQLIEAGVKADRISVMGECTACSRLPDGKRKYFSHRSEHGFTGRMLNVIGASE